MRKIEIGPWLCDTPANDNLSDVFTKFENASNRHLREILKLFFIYMFFSRLNKLYIVSLEREPDSYELCVAHPDLLLFPTLRKGIVVPVEEKDMFKVEDLNFQMCKLISSLNLLKVHQVQKNLEKLSRRVLKIPSGNLYLLPNPLKRMGFFMRCAQLTSLNRSRPVKSHTPTLQ